MIQELPVGLTGVEVGVQRGDFAAQMLCTRIRQLHLVDCWRPTPNVSADLANIDEGGHEENYRFTLNRFLYDIAERRVVVHRAPSLVAAERLGPMSLDFAYIDADHSFEGALADLEAWEKTIKPGGWLMGHDYVDNEASRQMGFGVIAAVDEFCRRYPWDLVALTNEEWPSFQLRRRYAKGST
jgi:hypothetical protein